MKLKLTLCWIFLFIVLAAFLEWARAYHFFFVEQFQLFQLTGSYLIEKVSLPGGLALWLSEWLVQYFIVPLAGPLIVAGLLTAIGILTRAILKRMAPGFSCPACYLLPGTFLLFLHFDFNYLTQGTAAYIIMLAALWLTLLVQRDLVRLVTGLVVTPLLFWVAGPIVFLYAICWSLYELLNRTSKGWLSLLACAEVLFAGVTSFYWGFVGEYRLIFLPDGYYQPQMHPKLIIYFAWICLPLLVLGAMVLRKQQFPAGKIKRVFFGFLQVAVITCLLYIGYHQYGDSRSSYLKKIDYYARQGQWDKVIESAGSLSDNYLYLCYLNMALAAKGQLAEKMFHYDQANVSGLAVVWNKSVQVSILLSDIAFVIGHTATAQNMAFEAYVSSLGEGNPRMLMRLVQTNLVQGAYPVAGKYITILENTRFYRKWATGQRKFLYNDKAVEADPVLGRLKASLPHPDNNQLSLVGGLFVDLEDLISSNPSTRVPVDFMGAFL
ncbi:MAG: DUF6057 family protein, partial [Tannerellaceae bacterium]|nr:DUF6057 family protein [Tannerellaceae bacterium]